MKKNQKGFTLIELMIVVAIIAILAAIAIPQYQNYVARSQISRAVGEVSALKTAVEDCLANGADPSDATECPNAQGTSMDSSFTDFTPFDGDGDGTMTAEIIGGSSRANGSIVTLERTDSTGLWECTITGMPDASLAPKSCPGT